MKNTISKAGCAILAVCLLFAASNAVAGDKGRSFRSGQLQVMTQNLYVGGDIFLPFSAETPEEFAELAQLVIGQILATDYRERAVSLAGEMLAADSHLIGLQEVYVLRVCAVAEPGFCLLDDDYLEILLDELNADGERYRAVAQVTNIDIPGLPLFIEGFGLVTVSITDRDVILAREDVETSNPVGANFCAGVPVPEDSLLFPLLPQILRGYTMVDARVKGRDYRFVNTHLEISEQPVFSTFQSLQAFELVGPPDADCPGAGPLFFDDHTIVLVGDFNSDPGAGPLVPCLFADGTPGNLCPTPYAIMSQIGYIDAWNLRRGPFEDGLTCCQDGLLRNEESELSERVDQIWVRQAPDHYGGPVIRGARATVLGDEPADKTPNGLWPSDHAGVAARMVLRVPK
ncbi:MAG: hypothetical protein WBN65_09855 [Gammaproteobacteria bacterium]